MLKFFRCSNLSTFFLRPKLSASVVLICDFRVDIFLLKNAKYFIAHKKGVALGLNSFIIIILKQFCFQFYTVWATITVLANSFCSTGSHKYFNCLKASIFATPIRRQTKFEWRNNCSSEIQFRFESFDFCCSSLWLEFYPVKSSLHS